MGRDIIRAKNQHYRTRTIQCPDGVARIVTIPFSMWCAFDDLIGVKSTLYKKTIEECTYDTFSPIDNEIRPSTNNEFSELLIIAITNATLKRDHEFYAARFNLYAHPNYYSKPKQKTSNIPVAKIIQFPTKTKD